MEDAPPVLGERAEPDIRVGLAVPLVGATAPASLGGSDADPAGSPVDAAGEGGTSTKVSTRTGVRATVATACSRAMWTWWGGDSTPVGGTDGVRPGGRGDRRRSGGDADQAARRSPRGPSRSRRPRPAVIGGRGRTSACAAAWGTRTLRKRVESQPRALPERGVSGGSKGGGALPLASPPRSTWRGLAYNPKSVSQPLGGAAEHASPGIARNSLDRAVARQLLGLPVAGLKDGKGDRPGSRLSRDCATLCRAPGFRPTRTPPRPEIVR